MTRVTVSEKFLLYMFSSPLVGKMIRSNDRKMRGFESARVSFGTHRVRHLARRITTNTYILEDLAITCLVSFVKRLWVIETNEPQLN